MRGADQRRLVRMVADRHQVEAAELRLEQHVGASDRELADAALAEAAADHDALGLVPGLELQEALDDAGERLGELLDRALDDAGRLVVAVDEQVVERLLADLVRVLVAEGVGAVLAQRLAPFLEDLVEGAPARPVPDEPLLVLDLGIVAVDPHGREQARPVDPEGRRRDVGHEGSVPVSSGPTTNGPGKGCGEAPPAGWQALGCLDFAAFASILRGARRGLVRAARFCAFGARTYVF